MDYKKWWKEPPIGIIITLPVKYFFNQGKKYYGNNSSGAGYFRKRSKREYITRGYSEFLKKIYTLKENHNEILNLPLHRIPEVEILYCYICCFNKICWRVKIAGYLDKNIFYESEQINNRNGLTVTNPQRIRDIHLKGFAGIKYKFDE